MGEQEHYMAQALELARQALETGDVPVGCVIVQNGQIVGRGRNRREAERTALGHAEVEAKPAKPCSYARSTTHIILMNPTPRQATCGATQR